MSCPIGLPDYGQPSAMVVSPRPEARKSTASGWMPSWLGPPITALPRVAVRLKSRLARSISIRRRSSPASRSGEQDSAIPEIPAFASFDTAFAPWLAIVVNSGISAEGNRFEDAANSFAKNHAQALDD